ncbi:hypothetical protein IW152_001793 [Coemansia sp. BCRC 34962]|nr:hypothetical protein IW152_001793 [Coemansia sp. BCRC 34962]
MSKPQVHGTAESTMQFLRDCRVDPDHCALVSGWRQCLASLDNENILESNLPQVARLPNMALSTGGVLSDPYTRMLLRPRVVKRHLAVDGKLRRFLDAGPPPVLACGTGLVRSRERGRMAPGRVALDNVLYFTGCAGTGKSYVLRELAARAMQSSANVRVVFIDDCRGWAALDEWAQVSFLVTALAVGFAMDEGFGAMVFQGLTLAEMTNPEMLSLHILDSVSRFCKTQVDEAGRPLRVLFCVDGYSVELAEIVAGVVQAIAQRSNVFFLALATTANEYVPRFAYAATRIPPQYSEDEALAMLAHYGAEMFDLLARERITAYESLVRRLVYQNTAFHPGDMALLFERAKGAADFKDFGRRIGGFTTDYAGLDDSGGEEAWRGAGLERTCLRPVLSESAYQFAEAVFRMFFRLPMDQGSGDVGSMMKCGANSEYNAHFQMVGAGERGLGSPGELEFVSPRRANFMFDLVSRDECVFTTVSRRLGLGGRGRYEMAFACVLWMLRREGMDFLASRGASSDHRLFGGAPKTREDIRADCLRPFAPGVSVVGYYSAANAASSCGPMRGLDFVTFQRCGSHGLASFVLATGCDAVSVDYVMENCPYMVRSEDSAASVVASAEECAIAGISEACRVAQHLGMPQSTVYLVVSEHAYRNASSHVAVLLGPLAPRLKLVSIKTVLQKSALLPVNELPQLK